MQEFSEKYEISTGSIQNKIKRTSLVVGGMK